MTREPLEIGLTYADIYPQFRLADDEALAMALNAHQVFNGGRGEEGYLAALTLDGATEQMLRNARDRIRGALKEGLRNWEALIQKHELFEAAFASAEMPHLRPKFRMQGSFSYRTCNVPAQNPPQEIDLDDGVFLPVSFLSQNGSMHPAVVSRGFFAAVEKILAPLCMKQGWKLIKDKASCVRVQISKDAHVDLALYAIPDQEFVTLVEAAASIMPTNIQGRVNAKTEVIEGIEFAEELYRGLKPDHIMLAHREEGWKPSDPRKLDDWFQAALKNHGEQVRRICRYLKGWRDHQWRSSRLSSIALMAAVVKAYKEATDEASQSRDDKALLMVVERLPAILSGEIENPVVSGQRLDEGWTQEERYNYVEKAKELLHRIQNALLYTNNAKTALVNLTAAFGDRIPDDTSLVIPDDVAPKTAPVNSPAVLTLGLLKDIGEEPAVREAVKKEGDSRYG